MRLFFLLSFVLLTGCATMSPAEGERPLSAVVASVGLPAPVRAAPAPPPPAPGSGYSPVPGTYALVLYGEDKPKKSLIFRDYLLPGFHSNQLPHNFVLLPKKPSNSEEHAQYRSICENWLANFSPISEAKSAPANVRIVSFYWLVKKHPKNETCDELIALYDYSRAQFYAIEKNLDLNRIYIVCDLGDGTALMDITRVTRSTDVTRSFQLWKTKTSSVPKIGTTFKARSFTDSVISVLYALSSFIIVK